jgi:hypothetical protein
MKFYWSNVRFFWELGFSNGVYKKGCKIFLQTFIFFGQSGICSIFGPEERNKKAAFSTTCANQGNAKHNCDRKTLRQDFPDYIVLP